MEKRFKLSDVQFEAIRDAQARVDGLASLHAEATRLAVTVQRLVNDALGITGRPQQGVDPETRELIVVVPDPMPAPQSTPSSS